MTYHAKIISGGKVVIPAALRRELGLKDGDEIVVERVGDSAVLKSRHAALQALRARVKAGLKNPVSVDQFIAGRRAEAAKE